LASRQNYLAPFTKLAVSQSNKVPANSHPGQGRHGVAGTSGATHVAGELFKALIASTWFMLLIAEMRPR